MKRHWIPPLGLAFGQLSHGLSWILALWIATRAGIAFVSPAEIAWIHLVALGWLTMTALSILLHAIPAFVEVRWRYEGVARTALYLFALSVATFVAAFLWSPRTIFISAIVLGVALTIYLTTAWSTLAPAFRSPERIDRAVARAFAITLLMLFLAMLLGMASASIFSASNVPAWITHLPPAHAGIALFGWLTLLVYGVSARTLRPITGNRSKRPLLHVISGSATLLGALLLASGLAATIAWLTWIGASFIAVGATAYVVDVGAILSGATVTYRPPQYFISAGVVWLIVALAFGAGTLSGQPWHAAFVFVMLAGWAGQMVNGHIFHIGVRLIATIYRGDEDETEPSELLDPLRPWLAFATMQLAITFVAIGLLSANAIVAAGGAALGFIGWLFVISSLASARRRALAG